MAVDTMETEVVDLQGLVVEEKIRYSKSVFPQTTLDTDDYNEQLSRKFAHSIADSLEKNSIDSQLIKHARDPFKLGTIIELIRTVYIAPFQNTSSNNFTFRKNVGMFYTPKSIVEYIVKKTLQRWFERIESIESENTKQAVDAWMNLTLIDPACGTGSFLVVTATSLIEKYESFMERSKTQIPSLDVYKKRLFTNILHGVDVDPIAVRLCKANLRYHLGLDAEHEPRVYCGDSLLAPLYPDPEFKPLEGWPEPINFSEQFTDVFHRESPGFDVLMMNPPYGKLRAESGKGIRKHKHQDFAEKKRYENLREHIRKSNMYPSSRGVLNWYKLFIERSLRMLNDTGSLGFIVPSTLLCDDSTKGLRKALLEHEITHLLEIPEKNNFFESVTQSFSIGIVNKQKQSETTDFRFGVSSMEEAETERKGVVLKDITDVTEESFSIPLTTSHGLSIFLKMHQHQSLSKMSHIINKRGEVDLTVFKPVLRTLPEEGTTRLLRGADVGFCRLRPLDAEKPSLIDRQRALQMLGASEKAEHLSMKRIVCQQIANQNNADRLIFAPIEEDTFCANSLNYICWRGDDADVWNSVLLGLLNSTLLDWRFRITSTNNHVNNYELDDLPLPIEGTRKPVLTPELREVAGIADQLRICPEEEIEPLRNVLDEHVFSLYKLTKSDIKFVLEQMAAN